MRTGGRAQMGSGRGAQRKTGKQHRRSQEAQKGRSGYAGGRRGRVFESSGAGGQMRRDVCCDRCRSRAANPVTCDGCSARCRSVGSGHPNTGESAPSTIDRGGEAESGARRHRLRHPDGRRRRSSGGGPGSPSFSVRSSRRVTPLPKTCLPSDGLRDVALREACIGPSSRVGPGWFVRWPLDCSPTPGSDLGARPQTLVEVDGWRLQRLRGRRRNLRTLWTSLDPPERPDHRAAGRGRTGPGLGQVGTPSSTERAMDRRTFDLHSCTRTTRCALPVPALRGRSSVNYEGMEASEQLRTLVNGFRVSQALHVAAVLGVSDVLAGGPVSVEGVAGAVDADPDSLRRLLRALAAVGVYVETESGDFANSELSEALRTGVPGTVNAWATFIGEPYYWQSWGHLLHIIRTGENAFRSLYGTDVWTYRAGDPARAAVFDAAMTGLAARDGRRRRGRLRVPRVRCCRRRRRRARSPAGRTADGEPEPHRHPVRPAPRHRRAGQALADEPARRRIRLAGGDMFEAVPSGADVYCSSRSCTTGRTTTASRSCGSAARPMTPASVILIIERLLDGPNQGADTKFSDLNMLVMPGGRERTEAEFARLVQGAGLRHRRTLTTTSPWSVIEAALAP